MCGICGIALGDRERRVDPTLLKGMCDLMVHRGPDDAGTWIGGNVGLGHRRLSIVDVALGHQPMANEDESVWVSFNGEIYNHGDFRADLISQGHVYHTRSDTECLLHLYEEDDWRFVEKLRGIFAFAIWDQRRRRLLLARDALGVKPLYYAMTVDGDLVFASEVKAVLAACPDAASLNEGVVPEYLANGFIAGSSTLFRGVRKLLPGHVLVWQDGAIEERPYWRAEDWIGSHVSGGDAIEAAAPETFWPRFVDAVQSQLMSDVPLGVFLSGGLDSSLVVAAMRERGVDEISTFSVGYEEQAANELPFARIVSEYFETDHHEVVIGGASFFDQLPELTWHSDTPLRFSASIPLYAVSRLAQESVKVVLAGEGADELFAGYGRYQRGLLNLRAAALYSRMSPRFVRRAIRSRIESLGNGYFPSRLKRSFLARPAGFVDAYLEPFAIFDGGMRAGLLGHLGSTDAYASERSLLDEALFADNPLEAILRFDQETYLEELLMKQDKMSMAASIESRVPFLDQPLVAWSRSLSPSAKLRWTKGKYVARSAAQGRLPEAILGGPKRGFRVPLGEWLRGVGRPFLEEVVPVGDGDLLSGTFIRQLIEEHDRGVDHTERLWLVLAFQVWKQTVLDRDWRTNDAVLGPVHL